MKFKRWAAFGAAGVMLCSLFGCQRAEPRHLDAFEGSVRIAAISTCGLFSKSEVHFYDENLEPVQTDKLPYANISDQGVMKNEKLYFAPGGIGDVATCKYMVEYNPGTGEHKKLQVDRQGLLNVEADSQAAYTWNNRNFLTTVTRYDLQTGERTIYETSDFSVNCFYEKGDLLYALATDLTNATTNYFVVFDKQTMELVKTVVLGDKFCGYGMVEFENTLYFTGNVHDRNSVLYELNLDTYEFKEYPLSNERSSEIRLFQGNSILIFWDQINRGKDVSIINLKTKEETSFTLEHSLIRSCVDGNTIYAYGWDSALHKYAYDGAQFVHEKEVKVPGDENSYFGGIYLLPGA